MISMKKHFPFIFFFVAALMFIGAVQAKEELFYQISQSTSCLMMQGRLKSDQSFFKLRLPPGLSQFKLRTKEKIELQKTNDPLVIHVINPKKVAIDFSYQYCMDNPQRDVNYPIIEKDFFYFFGAHALMMPEQELENKVSIHFDFEQLPKDAMIANSFNINQRRFERVESIHHLRSALFVAGNIKVETFWIKENPVYILTKGKWPYFNKKISDYLKPILVEQRNFWQEYSFPHYVIFLIQQNHPPIPKFSLGAHFHNAYVALLPAESDMLAEALYTLSHESFHAWLGEKVRFDPNGDLKWFWEGFNDYYGLRFAYQSGTINYKKYIKLYNFLMMEYALSPALHFSSQRLQRFVSYYDFIAQIRGHLVAYQLHEKLKQQGKSFDQAFKSLCHHYCQSGAPYLTFAAIDQHFNLLFPSEWQWAKKIIEKGEVVDLLPAAFSDAKRIVCSVEAPVFGFDVIKLIEEGVISNVNPHSHAFKAGLRSGQKVLGYHIDFKSATNQAVIYLAGNSVEKIAFFPNKRKVDIPQYQLVNELKRMKCIAKACINV